MEELAAQYAIDQHTKDGLIESLKREKRCRKRGKKLNLVGEEDNGPQLFSTPRVQAAQAFQAEKEEKEKQERARIDANKVATRMKKQKKDAEKAEKALQASAREANKDEVKAQEKSEKQAQKKKEDQAKKASNNTLLQTKSPAKPRKAPVCKKKVVRFANTIVEEGGEAGLEKRTKTGRIIKPPRIFEQGI